MRDVFDILEELESTPSRLAKEEIMRGARGNTLLKKIFTSSVDPYLDYGIRKFHDVQPRSGKDLDSGSFISFVEDLLPQLADRTLTGNAARSTITSYFANMNEKEQKWARRILLKNLRCGVSEGTIDKTWPGALRKFSVALAESAESKFENGKLFISDITYPVAVEPKLDGLRLICVKSSGVSRFFTRNGTEIFTLKRIKESIETIPLDNIVFDGEAFSPTGGWNESASIMMSAKKMKDDAAINYYIFDMLPLEEWEKQNSKSDYSSRSSFLLNTLKPLLYNHNNVRIVEGIKASSADDILRYYTLALDDGYEGIMIKELSATYSFKRSSAILKLKPVATVEGVVVGCYEGNMGTKREGLFGGFEVLLSNGVITRVGSGMTDDIKSEVQLLGPDTYVGKIVELSYQPPLTEDGKARFPVFERFRMESDVDKSVLEAYKNYNNK